MNTLLSFAGGLVFTAALLPAHAQSLPKVTVKTVNPQGKAATERQTAARRAAAYQGPKVVKDTKALGNKMLRDSKPASRTELIPVAPAKQ